MQSLKYDFKDESIHKMVLAFESPCFGAAIGDSNTVYTLAQNNKKIHQISLPDEPAPKVTSRSPIYFDIIKKLPHF